MKQISILGSTGSIGINTLNVIKQHPDKYIVFALSAWNNSTTLLEQIKEFKPKYVVINTAENAKNLQNLINSLNLSTQVLYGENSLCEIVNNQEIDIVMSSIVGIAGLKPTFAAAKAGKTILLANKESLVVSGNILMDITKTNNSKIIPIDSEHNAIFQCYANKGKDVRSIILTASGGPFLNIDITKFTTITPEMACKHPKWNMGQKISIDSATMMNKGLELIEAYWLFPQTQNNIKIVVHPQSIIHSLVEYIDGSIIAQLSHPDMKLPIAYGLAYPDRINCNVEYLDITTLTELNFYQPDLQKFPCINLAKQALEKKQCITLNAANEIAVEAFLQNKISFLDISIIIESTLNNFTYSQPKNIEEVLEIDKETRIISQKIINHIK